jgi:hypothetical protein
MDETSQKDARRLENVLAHIDQSDIIYMHLSIALSAGVPLYILELAEQGGPSDDQRKKASACLKDLGERGADLYFRSKKEGDTASRYDQVAYTVAVLSFSEGGITAFGRHYDGRKMQERFYRRKHEGFFDPTKDEGGTVHE